MRVSLSWLREFVELPLAPEELRRRLEAAGLEVEGVETVGPRLDRVITARIEAIRRHPGADRLSLCEVHDGQATRRIVCGATNIKPGDRVPLALEGAVLPSGVAIREVRIRGEVSQGMLCSAAELGLGEDGDGILILPPDAPLGVPVTAALGLEDTVFTLKVYPNRPDLLSMLGVAREVAAVTGQRLKAPALPASQPGEAGIPVTIADPRDCARYVGRRLEGIAVGPSPAWLARRLTAAGLRPLNAVVDVTNYVMLELGQPLHAFDADRLAGPRIEVRRARPGERLTTLDGVERRLDPGILVIADAAGPVALAGIMGGEPTEVSASTRRVFLESASFDPVVVRRAAGRLGLRTEAAYRFERRVDPEGCLAALNRACQLLAELAIAEPRQREAALAGGSDVYPAPPARRTIALSVPKLNRLLGLAPPLDREAVAGYLERLALPVRRAADPERLVVEPPSFRPDLERDVDLIEEVARLHGYDAVPYSVPRLRPAGTPPGPVARLAAVARESLVAFGFSEAMSFAFIAPAELERLGLREGDPRRAPLVLRNPLSAEMSVMRTTLLPGLLAALVRNVSRGIGRLRLFEIGKVFLPRAGEPLPAEPTWLAALMAGPREPAGWLSRPDPVDFYDASGVVEALGRALGVPGLRVAPVADPGETPYLHPRLSARVEVGPEGTAGGQGVAVGAVGALHPELLERLDVGALPVFVLELCLDALVPHAERRPRFRPLPRFPAVVRDLALVLDATRPAAEVLARVRAEREPLLREVAVFDVYEGPQLPPGKRSLGLTFTYQADDRTLTDEEVNRIHGRLARRLAEALGAEIRQ
ncbi:MAG TPA: phenylalanine--tRNA ligase subunit beta [Thermodesulfobacteriota bacterium]|nr:phenylalanine--tRNA ligase subunit beta [Thermodesulfobacteriota bacterium]